MTPTYSTPVSHEVKCRNTSGAESLLSVPEISTGPLVSLDVSINTTASSTRGPGNNDTCEFTFRCHNDLSKEI